MPSCSSSQHGYRKANTNKIPLKNNPQKSSNLQPRMDETMDDSFRVRVEKIFGSLTSSSSNQPASSLQSTLWSLTDDEVERREWRRGTGATDNDRDEIPCASSFDELKNDLRRRRNHSRKELEDNLDDDYDEEEEEESKLSRRGGKDDLDEWEIRSSIGLDPTLDNEEEEDEYDKVASGRENAGDRLYMKNVTDHGSYLNFHNVLPKSIQGTRDPRANRLAANVRLQEDEAEARKLNSHDDCDAEVKEPGVKLSNEGGGQLRSILKRKHNHSDFKANKHVRFDPGCKIVSEEEESENIQDISMGTSTENAMVSEDGYMLGQNAFGVPDYLQNPSKYTRYSFDSSSEVDEKSNTQAFMDFLKLVKASKPTESGSELEDASAELPKSVTFVPKKKSGEVKAVNSSSKVKRDEEDDGNQSLHHKGFTIGIAASEVVAMEADEAETNAVQRSVSFRKPGRSYRTKSSSDEFDP